MLSTIVGGAMLPHAPQFFTLPDTEDKTVVEQVRKVAADIGRKLKALKPDLWIIFSNDHAEQFFHNAAPPFTVHVGGEATGEFAGRHFHWQIRVRSASSWCASSTAKASTRRSPAPPRSTTPSASRSPT